MQLLTYRWGRKYETHNVGTYGPQVFGRGHVPER